MKKFFYLAIAVMTAMSFTACGSDDDSPADNGFGGTNPVTITPAKLADVSQAVVLNTPVEAKDNDLIKLKEFNIMDGGQVAIVTEEEGKSHVYVADIDFNAATKKATIKNSKILTGEFQIMDKVASSRADNGMSITFNLSIKGNIFNTEGGPADCAAKNMIIAGGMALSYLAQEFKVNRMTIKLEGDVNAFKDVNGGKLIEIYNIAKENGAEFTATEAKDFEKEISYISISKTGIITITYADGQSDGGNWNWANQQWNKLNLRLLAEGMGNKFIPQNAGVDVKFDGNQCALTINADIKGSKNYSAKLTLLMTAVK